MNYYEKKITILKITDGKAGHITVSDGIIEAIKKIADVEVVDLNVKIKLKFFLRILRFILKYKLLYINLFKNDFFIKIFYKNYNRPTNKIDLILSTGGDTLFINIWLSYILNAKNIFSGTLRGIDSGYFFLVISALDLNIKNSIKLNVIPTRIKPMGLQKKVDIFRHENNMNKSDIYFVLLIGGDGSGYEYERYDYENLINYFMTTSKRYKAKALITTSRRTGKNNEELIKELLLKYSDDIAYSVYFGQKPEKVVALYLELASVIFVTEESGSMISESIFTKKPIFILYPETIKEDKKHKTFLNNICDKNMVARVSINRELSNLDINKFKFNFIDKLPTDELAEKIQPYIKDIVS